METVKTKEENEAGDSGEEENVDFFASLDDGSDSYDEGMFDADVDWEGSESLRRIFEGEVEASKYQSLPESGSALMHHDLANYFQGGIYSEVINGGIEPFDTEIHFGDRGEVEDLDVNVEPWGEVGQVKNNKADLEKAYTNLKEEDPTSENSITVLDEASNDESVPQFAREVTYRAAQVAKAAKAYHGLRGSEAPDETTELDDAIWAFDRFTGIDLEVAEGIEKDQEVIGNEALKFTSSTLVQNAYEAEVLGDTDVRVERTDEGDIAVTYESSTEGCEDLGEDIFEYDTRDDGGLGLSVSSYIVEKFGGEMTYEGDEESFRLTYTLQTPE